MIPCARQRPCASDVFGVRSGPGLVRKPRNGKPLRGGHFGKTLIDERVEIGLPHPVPYPTPNLQSFQPTLPYQSLYRFWADIEQFCHLFNRIHRLFLPGHVVWSFRFNDPS